MTNDILLIIRTALRRYAVRRDDLLDVKLVVSAADLQAGGLFDRPCIGVELGPLLDPAGDWAPDESVQVIMEDLTTDDLMRTFEALSVDFRLSLPYQARVVVVAEPADRRPPLVLRTRTEARL